MKSDAISKISSIKGDDKDHRVIDLFLGVAPNGRPFYAYLAIIPERYVEYRDQVSAAQNIEFAKFGDIIIGGWDAVPPAIVQRGMTDHFGFIHNFEERLQ